MKNSTQPIITDSLPVNVVTSDSLEPTADDAEFLRRELEAERDQHLRLAAEYKNYRRRTEQEKADAAAQGKRELLTELLSFADDFDLAAADSKDSTEAVAEGLRMIHRRFLKVLAANDVVAFESSNKRFDPERHEAFDVVPAGDFDSGTVQTELRRGYDWNGKLLRPALVVIRQ